MYTDHKTRTCKNSHIILEHMLDWRTFKVSFVHDLICEWNLWMLQYVIEINLSVKSQNVLYNFSNRVCIACRLRKSVLFTVCSSGYVTLWLYA